jgi:carbonic anhydrase
MMTLRPTVLASIIFLAVHAPVAASEGPRADGKAVLQELVRGNDRFVAGKPRRTHLDAKRRQELTQGQHPRAAILGCADSRVPPEHVFDQGLGDLFVVRLAGNIPDESAIGSLEYAVEHLGTSLVLVLGHHGCGAVQAAMAGGHVEGNLGSVLEPIAPAVAAAKANGRLGHKGGDQLDAAIHENARLSAKALVARSPLLRRLVEEGKLQIAVGVYDLDTGKVDLERN